MTGAARGLIIVVSGPSGVGKGTVVARLLDRLGTAEVSTSATTRAPREGELDGREYHFVDEAGFEALVTDGALLEWAEYAGNRYGTPAAPVEEALRAGRDVLLEIEVRGALQIRAARPDALLVFLTPPSLPELERRLRGRGTDSDEAIARRLEVARRELDEALSGTAFDHVVVNDDLDRCVHEIVAAVAAARTGL